jgi:hypothetical protein
MAFKQLRICFSGSFQWRLSGRSGPSNATRSNPNSPGPHGWTHDYGKAPFDRIVRFHTRVELQSALIDSFTPAKVTTIDVQQQSVGPFELPFQTILWHAQSVRVHCHPAALQQHRGCSESCF